MHILNTTCHDMMIFSANVTVQITLESLPTCTLAFVFQVSNGGGCRRVYFSSFSYQMTDLISSSYLKTIIIEKSSIMLVVAAILIPLIVLKIISTFPNILHKKNPLGRKGICRVIAHRGSRDEGELEYDAPTKAKQFQPFRGTQFL